MFDMKIAPNQNWEVLSEPSADQNITNLFLG